MSSIDKTLTRIFPQDSESRDIARNRLDKLAMPHWALGDLLDLSIDLAGITRSINPPVTRKAIVTMAGDHGVVVESVSKYPREVTSQMVANFINGGAGINALAKVAGAKIFIVDMGVADDLRTLAKQGKIINKKVGLGTDNIAVGPAMSRAMAVRAVESGIDIANELAEQIDVFGTGDMGIGNTTPSTAIAAVCTGLSVGELAGRGTGLDDAQLQHKVQIIEQAIACNKPDNKNGIDILAKVGGFEIGGIAGLILGAAANRKPIVVDGFISTAAAHIAAKIEPFVKDYLIFSHRSAEPGHQAMLAALGCRKPLLDLNFRLGEGTGAAMAMPLVDGAAAILTGIATFAEAAVSQADK
jgi:nicotinate-nucleotide--dimethylbenzimidazole phosphoribosyltransferase